MGAGLQTYAQGEPLALNSHVNNDTQRWSCAQYGHMCLSQLKGLLLNCIRDLQPSDLSKKRSLGLTFTM